MVTAGIVRTLLIVDMVGMALLALFFLRQRRMNWQMYCWWGLLALLVPVLGPFALISRRPGEFDPSASVFNDVKRFARFIKQLFPKAHAEIRLSRLQRARQRRLKRQEK